MSLTKCLSLFAGAAVSFGAISVANAEARSENTDEIRAIVAEMLADADTRSSFLQSGGTAGHDGKNFFLASPGGDFRLNVGGQIQFRYLMNFGDDLGGQADEDWESGFQTRRTKLWFDGTVFDEFDFKVQWNFDRDGGGAVLEDAYVSTPMGWDGWNLKWGQFKAPFMREELVSSTAQLAVDRSHMNEVFNQDRSQGIQVGYSADDWRLMIMFSDGFGSDNSDYSTDRGLGTVGTAGGVGGESDYAFTGRFEYKFAGDWGQFKDFTSPSGSNWGVLLGGALHYEGGDSEGNAVGADDYNYLSWTADISVEGDGWNLYAAGVGGYTDFEDVGGVAGADADFDDYGIVIQGGLMIPDTDWEVFGRYDAVFPDSDRASDDAFNVITAGVNYYMHGHAAKFTADVQWFIDDPADSDLASPSTGIGFLGDSDSDEFGIRLQFQLLF